MTAEGEPALADRLLGVRGTFAAAQVGESSAVVQVHGLAFDDPVSGLPTMLRWLVSQGCAEVHYGLFDPHAVLEETGSGW